MTPILEIRDLHTAIGNRRGAFTVVEDVNFTVDAGECLGIVGESGSGKSMTCRSILGLLPPPIEVTEGEVWFDGINLRTLSEPKLNAIRGNDIAMIVQDAVAALNPVWRIGDQIGETMIAHGVARSRGDARTKTIELMRKVGIPAPEERIDDYPHQFSGGMCQRVVIAAALACSPRMLIADEPTTALDVTIQDQILKLMIALQHELGLSILLVTHDMGVVAQACQRVAVMYAGEIVELTDTESLFKGARHPYSSGLLNCMPRLDEEISETGAKRLSPIPGAPPDLSDLPRGCRFHPRCPLATDTCRSGAIPLVEVKPGHFSRCLHHEALAANPDIWAEGVPA